MKDQTERRTIAAIATPPGIGAVCIVRLSGPDAFDMVRGLVRFDLEKLLSHQAKFARLWHHDELIDEVLIIPFRNGASFTGEDVVEIQGHGGPLVAARILQALVDMGAELAEPGEFSLRAFQNKKIDLTQAEAIQGMIHAKSERARRIHMDQLKGSLSEKVQSMRQKLVEIGALFEAWVDFPEEGLVFSSFESVKNDLEKVRKELIALSQTFKAGRFIHDGLRLCLVGAPNVGKSSLLNCLLGKERSIVSDTPGTTRDYIEEGFDIDGIPMQLVDTAGVRADSDHIEAIGIDRTWERAASADVILALFDASIGPDHEILEQLPLEKVCTVWNKIDLEPSNIKPIESGFGSVEISAKKGVGIEAFKKRLVEIAGLNELNESGVVITQARHREAIERSLKALEKTLLGFEEELSPEFLALDMREAIVALSSIVGGSVTEDLLDALFSQFCLGK